MTGGNFTSAEECKGVTRSYPDLVPHHTYRLVPHHTYRLAGIMPKFVIRLTQVLDISLSPDSSPQRNKIRVEYNW